MQYISYFSTTGHSTYTLPQLSCSLKCSGNYSRSCGNLVVLSYTYNMYFLLFPFQTTCLNCRDNVVLRKYGIELIFLNDVIVDRVGLYLFPSLLMGMSDRVHLLNYVFLHEQYLNVYLTYISFFNLHNAITNSLVLILIHVKMVLLCMHAVKVMGI